MIALFLIGIVASVVTLGMDIWLLVQIYKCNK